MVSGEASGVVPGAGDGVVSGTGVNVSANTVSKYMRRETKNIPQETWDKIQPVIQAYLPRSASEKVKHGLELTADQKILLDAFDELPPDVQYQKLLEIIELAKKHLRARQQAEDAEDNQ